MKAISLTNSSRIENKILSVIVPVTKMSGRLDLLFSWLALSDAEKIQIIIIHDKQDEATSEELSKRLALSPLLNVHFIEGIFNSPGLARNAGMQLAQGSWIQFVDSDDLPDIDQSLALIKSADSETDAIVGGFVYQDITKSTSFKLKPSKHLEQSLALNPGIWRIIFRKKMLSGHKFVKSRMGEDQLFLIEIGLFKRNLHFSTQVIYRYSVNSSEQLTSRTEVLRDLMEIIPKTIDQLNSSSKSEMHLIGIMVARQILTFLRSDCSPAAKARFIFNQVQRLPLPVKFVLVRNTGYVLLHRNKYVQI